MKIHGSRPGRFRGFGRLDARTSVRMPGMRRDPPTRERLHSMCRVRVFAMRMNPHGTIWFQWKRSDLYSRSGNGPVEEGLKEI